MPRPESDRCAAPGVPAARAAHGRLGRNWIPGDPEGQGARPRYSTQWNSSRSCFSWARKRGSGTWAPASSRRRGGCAGAAPGSHPQPWIRAPRRRRGPLPLGPRRRARGRWSPSFAPPLAHEPVRDADRVFKRSIRCVPMELTHDARGEFPVAERHVGPTGTRGTSHDGRGDVAPFVGDLHFERMGLVGADADMLEGAPFSGSRAAHDDGYIPRPRPKPDLTPIHPLKRPRETGCQPSREQPRGGRRVSRAGEPDLDPAQSLEGGKVLLHVEDLRKNVSPGREARPREIVHLSRAFTLDKLPHAAFFSRLVQAAVFQD